MNREKWLNTPIETRISFVTSNMTGLGVTITLTDRMSGKAVATVDLTPAQFTELLSSRNVITMGELLPAEHYAAVGKRYVIEGVKDIPMEFVRYNPGWDAERRNLKGPTDQMNSWAEAQAIDGGWEGYRWSHHNYGWSLHVFRHEETTLKERQDSMKDRY